METIIAALITVAAPSAIVWFSIINRDKRDKALKAIALELNEPELVDKIDLRRKNRLENHLQPWTLTDSAALILAASWVASVTGLIVISLAQNMQAVPFLVGLAGFLLVVGLITATVGYIKERQD